MSDSDYDRCDVLLIGYEGQENLGLRSVAAFLQREEIQVDFIPLQDITKEQILGIIRQKKPRIVGLSLIFQRWLEEYASLIEFLRKNDVNTHFTIGGHFPTFEYKYLLTIIPGLDTVVRYEGEETLLELYENIDQPELWPMIKGLAFRQDGKICVTPRRPLIPELDALPFPVRKPQGATHRGIGIRSITGSRGCYYDCTFCSIHEFYRQSGPTRRTRSPHNLVQEMETLFHDFGVRIFIFQDDDLFMRGQKQLKWLNSFLIELETRKLHNQILWRVSCRVDDINAGLLRRMKTAGLAGVYLGIESGSDQGLKTFNKHYCVSDVYRALEILKEINLPFEFGFMLFEPYSTNESVRENIDFLKKINDYGDSLVHFCKMSPYAATPIAKRLAAEKRLEGTIACPDYRFLDSRLDLLQTFYSQTFNFRNFDERGLVERLRFAKFDACVVEKFFSKKYNTAAYHSSVRELILKSNESALETMSLAATFVENHTFSEIIDNWHMLEELCLQEKRVERLISTALDELMHQYGFEASLGSPETRLKSWPPSLVQDAIM